jgi:hypothetical protein
MLNTPPARPLSAAEYRTGTQDQAMTGLMSHEAAYTQVDIDMADAGPSTAPGPRSSMTMIEEQSPSRHDRSWQELPTHLSPTVPHPPFQDERLPSTVAHTRTSICPAPSNLHFRRLISVDCVFWHWEGRAWSGRHGIWKIPYIGEDREYG